MTDKQFDDAFTAAGRWFILTQYEEILNWTGSTSALVLNLFKKGFDNKITGTKTRVSSVIRLIENQRGVEALGKIRDSKRINQAHPEAREMAIDILSRLSNK